MKQRTIGAALLLIILISSLIISSKLFGIVMLIIAILGYNEFFNIKYNDNKKKVKLIRMIGIVSIILIVLNNLFYRYNFSVLFLLPLLALSIPVIIYNDNSVYNIEDCLYIYGIVCMLGFAFNNIAVLRDVAINKCIYIFIIAFITDTYAYIGGMLIGRHKLTDISPKKTVEGSIIGTIMGTLFGCVYCYSFISGYTIYEAILLSLFLTILSEIGDLMFSSIKRSFNKKDYSNLIPGHGGILDRFDSVIYVSLGLLLILGV